MYPFWLYQFQSFFAKPEEFEAWADSIMALFRAAGIYI